jgi:hypothetical protein
MNQGLAIEAEIRKEKASGLRRVGTRLESLIAELVGLEAELRTAAGDRRSRVLARHREVRAEAEKQQWYLIVQREAMGLTKHHDVYEQYKIPPAAS